MIAAAGSGLAPADRRLYALRDVTGTVESIPLIASSIMSKKIAEGTRALVLDVKTGTGAFMRDREQALSLARTMVTLGEENGVRTRALVTRMDTPLGRAVGNALEVEEAVAALRGDGPQDLMEVTFALAGHMLELAGIDADPRQAIASGRALDTFKQMIRVQGGDPEAPLPRAEHRREALQAPADGWVTRLDALAVGVAAWRLGAGRARKEDGVSHTAGVRVPGEAGRLRPAGRRRGRTPRRRPRPLRPGDRSAGGRADDRRRAADHATAHRRPGRPIAHRARCVEISASSVAMQAESSRPRACMSATQVPLSKLDHQVNRNLYKFLL